MSQARDWVRVFKQYLPTILPSALTPGGYVRFGDDGDGNAQYPAVDGSLITNVDYPKGYIHGGVMTPNASDANNDFDITACKARNTADTQNLSVAADTRQKDVIWSKAGPGGMAENGSTGSPVTVAANDTVHCFIIRETATGDLAYCLDTDFDGANIIGGDATNGWTIERRVGARLVDGSSNIIPYTVKGGDGSRYRVNYNTPIEDVSDGVTTIENTHALSVPGGVSLEAVIDIRASLGGASYIRVYDPSEDNVVPNPNNCQLAMATNSNNNVARLSLFTSSGSQIKSRCSAALLSSSIATSGYWEVR